MMKFSLDARSLLFTPATSRAKFPAAHRSAADVLIVDLEDSVGEGRKQLARSESQSFFTPENERTRTEAIRINALTTAHGAADLVALCSFTPRPSMVIVPKVEEPRELEIVESILATAGYHPDLMAIVETPRGIDNASSIAQGSRRMRALIFGAADYSSAIGSRRDFEFLSSARARVVNAARGANIDCIDAPVFNYRDAETLKQESVLARSMGFSGKLAIHPCQVEEINEQFSPDEETIDLARRIVTAYRSSSGDAASVDGLMIGRPFAEASLELLRKLGRSID